MKEVKVADMAIKVPDYYQQVDSMPEDPECSVPLMVQTENAMCFNLLFPITEDEAMPFDDIDALIAGIHEALGEDQGLIEAANGVNESRAFIYSIVKTQKGDEMPEGVQYTLTLDIEEDGKVTHVQGFYDEIGTTGMRDAAVFAMFEPDADLDERMAKWTFDPYSPDRKEGFLMNQSELAVFDDSFPAHPLSMAREFLSACIR